jgi:transcriptional regulator with XRE-family HTH domain
MWSNILAIISLSNALKAAKLRSADDCPNDTPGKRGLPGARLTGVAGGSFDPTNGLCNRRVSFDRKDSYMAKLSRPRDATAVDTHVGQKICARRIFLGMSQTELGDAIGLTFQQVQKYEKGMNRVGASRLQQISGALGVSPMYFFDGAPTIGKKMPAPKEGELSEGAILSFLATREGATLVRGFLAVKQKSIRHNLIEFIGTLKTQ